MSFHDPKFPHCLHVRKQASQYAAEVKFGGLVEVKLKAEVAMPMCDSVLALFPSPLMLQRVLERSELLFKC
jgi:hypothetical protein